MLKFLIIIILNIFCIIGKILAQFYQEIQIYFERYLIVVDVQIDPNRTKFYYKRKKKENILIEIFLHFCSI